MDGILATTKIHELWWLLYSRLLWSTRCAATPNGGTYGSVIAAAANLSGAVKGENVPVTLTYTGTANDGTEYNGTTPPTKAGTYTITATITDPNYKLDADTATAEFTVAKRSATVTPDNKSKVYEEKDPELTYKVSGVLDGEMLKGITLARAKGENAGKYAITVTVRTPRGPHHRRSQLPHRHRHCLCRGYADPRRRRWNCHRCQRS